MADESHKKHLRSFWSFYGHGFWKATKKSLEKYGLAIVLGGLVYSIAVLFVSKPIQAESFLGFDMSYWITWGIPAILLILFLVWHLARAPYEIYKKQFEEHQAEIEKKESKVASLESKIEQFFNQTAPLLIDCEIIAPIGASQNNCLILVQNPNPTQGIDRVELTLEKIDPPLTHASDHQATTDAVSLTAIEFSAIDMNGKALTGHQVARFPVFIVFEKPEEKLLQFLGGNGRLDEYIWRGFNNFSPKPNKEYILTFQARGGGLRQAQKQFKLVVFPKGSEPLFSLNEVKMSQ